MEKTKEVLYLFNICEKHENNTPVGLYTHRGIGRLKLPNSTNQSIAILLKFTYNVKNRKLMTDLYSHRNVQRDQSLHGFAQSSEVQIDDNQPSRHSSSTENFVDYYG